MRVLIAGDYYPNRRVVSLVENHETSVIADDTRELVSSVDYSIINYESVVLFC